MYRVFVVGPWLVSFEIERVSEPEIEAARDAGEAYGRMVATYIDAFEEFGAALVDQMTPVIEAMAAFMEAAAQAIEDADDGG